MQGLGLRAKYPSSTLFPFLFWGLLVTVEHSKKKSTLVIKGLLEILVGMDARTPGALYA